MRFRLQQSLGCSSAISLPTEISPLRNFLHLVILSEALRSLVVDLQDGVKSKNTGAPTVVKEQQLGSKRSGEGAEAVKEILLGDAGLYGRRVKDDEVRKSLTELVDEVTKGVPTEVLEDRLSSHRAEGNASAHDVMARTIQALGKAVVASYETPKTILRVAQVLADEPMLPEMIGTAAAGADLATDQSEKNEFFVFFV